MTSSEKILAGILEEAAQKADEIVKEAEEKALAAVEMQKAEAHKQAEQITAQAEKKAALVAEAGRSAAELFKRDAALACRRRLIEETLRDVVDHLNALPDREYFDFLADLIEKNRLAGEGELLLSERDLSRDRTALFKTLETCRLQPAEEPAEINGGFILRYHDILINGEWSALIHEKREMLVDQINRVLFSQAK